LIKYESFEGAKFWALNMDGCTNFYWSCFVKIKAQSKTKVIDLIEELKDKRRFVKYIRQDDAGEGMLPFERVL
jgi:hypothetical protein